MKEPYIPVELPGIVGLQEFKPETGAKVSALAHQLLRGPSSLSPGEREVIAAFVSTRNECTFCSGVHTAAASYLLEGGRDEVCTLIEQPTSADPKMRALLAIAAKVQVSGKDVTPQDIAVAREAGATDEDLHDTVLIAAAFCMFNRYVDGLASITPTDPAAYDAMGRFVAEQGYSRDSET